VVTVPSLAEVLQNALGVTPGELRDMALDVDERAADLAEYGDPRDYESQEAFDRHVQRLQKAAEILDRLADLIETGGVQNAAER